MNDQAGVDASAPDVSRDRMPAADSPGHHHAATDPRAPRADGLLRPEFPDRRNELNASEHRTAIPGSAAPVDAQNAPHSQGMPESSTGSEELRGTPRMWRLLGLPYDGGIPLRTGARLGPGAIREALHAFTSFSGEHTLTALHDLGDLALPTMDGLAAHRMIEEAAARVFEENGRVAFLGGDHGCTGSVIRGLAAARPDLRLALVSVDAHLDVREYESESRLSSGTPFRRALETKILTGSRVAMIGLRPFANSGYYTAWAREAGIHLRSVDEVEACGPITVAQEALDAVAGEADAIYLSIDLDVMDAAFAPGVSAIGTAGLTARETIDIVRTVASHPRIIGADVMELSPPYDIDSRTARLAARILLEVIGVRNTNESPAQEPARSSRFNERVPGESN